MTRLDKLRAAPEDEIVDLIFRYDVATDDWCRTFECPVSVDDMQPCRDCIRVYLNEEVPAGGEN